MRKLSWRVLVPALLTVGLLGATIPTALAGELDNNRTENPAHLLLKLRCKPNGAVELKSSFGAIEASEIPKGIRAITGNGAITLNDIGGDTFAKTSFGSVSVERIAGNLTVENSNGSVTAKAVKGDATVTTSFAGVTLESIGGKITVNNQNGGIFVTAARSSSGCRDISLKTSFSSIRVHIPEGLGYNVTARTSFGRISTDLPFTSTGSIGGDSLSGTIGSGGCQLQLTDSNGSIEIAKAP